MKHRVIFVILSIFINVIHCQDFTVYEELIDEGKIEEVHKSLPYLKSQYPNHPFIKYLEASANDNGDEALQQYRSIVAEYPGTRSCDLAIMKIGEYLYSKGLYTQAAEQLKIIPLYYPDSGNIERAVDLMKKSYLAIGEKDSVDLYIKLFSTKYPNLNIQNYDYYSTVILKEQRTGLIETGIDSTENNESETYSEQVKLGEKPWVIQVGAFKEKKNAETVMTRLESAGYDIEIIESSDEKKLFLVQIVRFATIERAINIGEELNDQFGLEFRIFERN